MDKLCTLTEKRDGTLEVRYNDERVEENFFIRTWKFVILSSEQIAELESATLQRVQEILKKL